jgi:hypothetical protein
VIFGTAKKPPEISSLSIPKSHLLIRRLPAAAGLAARDRKVGASGFGSPTRPKEGVAVPPKKLLRNFAKNLAVIHRSLARA